MTDKITELRERKAEARQSFTGRRLTNGQFEEAWAVAGVIRREIAKSGSFVEKLTDYAHAYARSERFDASRGEIILRDIFTARYGETMNQIREGLLERTTALKEAGPKDALDHARLIGPMIREGETMPFYQAYDRAGVRMARQHGITETGAREMMKTAYAAAIGRDLYTDGKAIEAQHHHPVRDAERAARKAERQVERRSHAQAGPQM